MTQSLKLFIAIIFIFIKLLRFKGRQSLQKFPFGLREVFLMNLKTLKKKKPTTVDSVGKMRIAYVDRPTLTVYPARKRKKANGTGVIICPGGGCSILAWTHEGIEIAQWLNSIGVSAFIFGIESHVGILINPILFLFKMLKEPSD